jgi:hypothetical protein
MTVELTRTDAGNDVGWRAVVAVALQPLINFRQVVAFHFKAQFLCKAGYWRIPKEILLTLLGVLDIYGTLFSLSLTILGLGMAALVVPEESGPGSRVVGNRTPGERAALLRGRLISFAGQGIIGT